ncbi:MAG: hypothetical protein PHT94_01920 [Candidatus Nanoarchaeia archaeon]|nr:hypothetical protein [Candidatus Nanoarchaeia archaeon]
MEYYNSMDQDFYSLDNFNKGFNYSNSELIQYGNLGISTNESPQLGGNYASQLSVGGRLRMGDKHIELNLGGYGNEPGGAATYGKDARQAIREISRSNKVDYTVHAPSNIKGVNGYDKTGYNISQEKEIEKVIKNTIDFAADIGSTGAIVLHSGEDSRDINQIPNIQGKIDGKIPYKFSNYFSDKQTVVDQIVDRRTGSFIGENGIKADDKIILPKFQTDENGNILQFTKNGLEKSNIKTFDLESRDEKGNLVHKKIPIIDFTDVANFSNLSNASIESSNGDMQTQELTYFDVENFTNQYNKINNKNHSATEIFAKLKYKDLINNSIDDYNYRYNEYNNLRKRWDRLMEAKKAYESFYPNLDEKNKKVFDILQNDFREVLPSQSRNPIEFIEEKEKEIRYQMNKIKDEAIKSKDNFENYREILNNIDSANKYAREKSIDKYAEFGLYTMQRSKNSEYMENKENPNHLFIALENIFPEWGYGSHPDELIDLVEKSRNKMVEKITKKEVEKYDDKGNKIVEQNPFYNPNITKKDAEKLSQEYIKATLDFQHLGMWKKYFEPIYLEDKKRLETKEETENRFNQWYLEQIKKLEKSKVIGHLHVADSMDESHQHLPAGQGVLPIKTAINYLIKNGYDTSKYKIVSEGFQEDSSFGQSRGITTAYRYFNPNASVTDVTSLNFMNVSSSVENYSGSSNYVTPNYMAPLKKESWSGWFDFRGL